MLQPKHIKEIVSITQDGDAYLATLLPVASRDEIMRTPEPAPSYNDEGQEVPTTPNVWTTNGKAFTHVVRKGCNSVFRDMIFEAIDGGLEVTEPPEPTIADIRASMPALTRQKFLTMLANAEVFEEDILSRLDSVETVYWKETTHFRRTDDIVEDIREWFDIWAKHMDDLWAFGETI